MVQMLSRRRTSRSRFSEKKHINEDKRQELSDKFYEELRNWYYWATEEKYQGLKIERGHDPDHALRIIVRLLLIFFLKEKELVPEKFFDENWVNENLENREHCYYNAILRNLFFHCLNTPITDRKDNIEHKELIINTKRLKEQFNKIPFLNGGLFNEHPGDDFALGNKYFFSSTDTITIKALDRKCGVRGLVTILKDYKYTLNETDNSEYIDPEFIGKTFECLLACIDADSKETRRKVTGSYYTPREIVDYMVSEALNAYLAGTPATATEEMLLLQCKILDPACGSGAFSCGIMNEIMRRIDPNQKLDQPARYRRKLEIVRKMIYGVDIQPMAVQISQLRLFLSLIQEIVPDGKKHNFGIDPLPNLETKFVCADTLIGLKKKEKNGQGLFEDSIVREKVEELRDTRNQYFAAKYIQEKERLRLFDEKLRNALSELMKGAFTHDATEKLVAWNPYNQFHAASFFDPMWMFGIEKFDIVIGNPPYGAKYSAANKKYFLKYYETAKTVKNKQKGSLDTFTLFIERGYQLCKHFGNLHYIVPIAITSSDSVTGVHNLLEQNCSLIKVSSYAVRPQPIFENAVVNTSILFCKKDAKQNEQILATKMYRKSKNFNLQHLLNNLQFIEVKDVKLVGRYPKISLGIEKQILNKILSQPMRIKNIVRVTGRPIYYRTTGGRYFKVITNYSTGSTKEKSICFNPKISNFIGAVLSSNLFFWFYQVFSNNL